MRSNELLRVQDVSRWTIVSTSRPQSLAEHSFNVAILANRFCELTRVRPEMARVFVEAALTHDIDEVYTGDIPTPAKRLMIGLGFNPHVLEKHSKVSGLNEDMQVVLKCLDLIESVHFLHNFGVGKHAKKIENALFLDVNNKLNELRDMRAFFAGTVEAIYKEVFDKDGN